MSLSSKSPKIEMDAKKASSEYRVEPSTINRNHGAVYIAPPRSLAKKATR